MTFRAKEDSVTVRLLEWSALVQGQATRNPTPEVASTFTLKIFFILRGSSRASYERPPW